MQADVTAISELAKVGGTIGLLNVVGLLLKATPEFPNRWIPHALVGVGIGIEIAARGVTLDAVIAGATAGWSAVGAHQFVRMMVDSNATTPPAPPTPPANPTTQ